MKHCSMTTLIVAIIVALAIGVYAGKNMKEEEYYGRPAARRIAVKSTTTYGQCDPKTKKRSCTTNGYTTTCNCN
jgi:hypothetical protein